MQITPILWIEIIVLLHCSSVVIWPLAGLDHLSSAPPFVATSTFSFHTWTQRIYRSHLTLSSHFVLVPLLLPLLTSQVKYYCVHYFTSNTKSDEHLCVEFHQLILFSISFSSVMTSQSVKFTVCELKVWCRGKRCKMATVVFSIHFFHFCITNKAHFPYKTFCGFKIIGCT